MTSEPVISVVIPAHNDAHNLRRLLPSLKTGFANAGVPAEIIVVANGCRDDSISCCTDHGVICLERPPLSPAAARNEGVAIARAGWLAFLDADVLPRPSWFTWIRAKAARASAGSRPFIAGWPVTAPAGAKWVAHAWQRVRFSPAHLPRTLDCANILVSRKLFLDLGQFDATRIAGEDVEFCERAIAAHVDVVFEETLAVDHFGEPAGLPQFFARELFHADPLRLVLRTCTSSSLDASLVALLTAALVSGGAAVLALLGGPTWLWWAALLAPVLSVVAALAKAGIKWHRGVSFTQFAQMVFLCQVMMFARVAGMFMRRSTWRTKSAAQ